MHRGHDVVPVDLDPGVAWCAQFFSWCYHFAGSSSINPKLARWAYCPFVASDARAGRNGLSIAQTEYWSDAMDRWAEDLVDPTKGGT